MVLGRYLIVGSWSLRESFKTQGGQGPLRYFDCLISESGGLNVLRVTRAHHTELRHEVVSKQKQAYSLCQVICNYKPEHTYIYIYTHLFIHSCIHSFMIYIYE